jgi:hypothetical protein
MIIVILFLMFAIANLSTAFIQKERGWKIVHLVTGLFCIVMAMQNIN